MIKANEENNLGKRCGETNVQWVLIIKESEIDLFLEKEGLLDILDVLTQTENS